MKTLSPTVARQNITRWLDLAIAGEDVAITHKGHVIKLQPVSVIEDWAVDEYQLTSEEMDRAATRLLQEGAEAIQKGKSKPIARLLKKSSL